MDTNIWPQNASQSISKVNLKHRIRNQVEIEQWRILRDVTEADGQSELSSTTLLASEWKIGRTRRTLI